MKFRDNSPSFLYLQQLHEVESSHQISQQEEEGDDDDDDKHRSVSTLSSSQQQIQLKCILCLSAVQHASTTICGHVFCWKCIIEWCVVKVCISCPTQS